LCGNVKRGLREFSSTQNLSNSKCVFFPTSFRLKIGDLSTTSRYENVQETLEFAVKTLGLPVKFPINQSFDIPVVL
jgi:hypothetical protein